MPGARLDRYELLCPVAHGGMASVWVARLTGKHGFEKLFAIKTILPHYAQDPRFQRMFLDEAKVASRIEHANVAQVLDLGEANDVLYLVMEWVDGDSLSKLSRTVRRRGDELPVGVLLRVLADTCAGLHAAHEVHGDDGEVLGVVHRDVSPQNILVSTKGIAKLIDFGVVKARGRVAGETASGQLKGKIHYMAPEQALGKQVDRRADVWSVAAVAYHMLAGVPAFDGENELATLHMLTSGAVPPPLPASVPPALSRVILGVLQTNPDRRSPQSAHEMQLAFERVMVETGQATTVADVATFAARYLGDRAEGRKRALETAIQAAAERRRVQKVLTPLEGDSSSGVGAPLEVDVALDSAEWRVPLADGERSDSTSSSGSVPSVASSATLGSAASEVAALPSRAPPPRRASRTVAAALGGVALLAGFLLWRHETHMGGAPGAAAESPPGPVAVAPPPASAASTPEVAPTAPVVAAASASVSSSASAKGPAASPAAASPPVRPKAAPPQPHPPAKKDYGF